MLKPISKNFKGLIFISGPTESGKSQLSEFLIKDQTTITYIATSKPRPNDQDWQKRINIHKNRRPDRWKIIEHPPDICKIIESVNPSESILIDSLGGLVEQHLMINEKEWDQFQDKFINCLKTNISTIIVVAEEIGWGIVPSTKIGHLFRERLSKLSKLVSLHSNQKWLAVNGMAIDLDEIGDPIP
tara:strand:+ start:241 stop:798 length:558 start_codon:yes stop_codon:yes gene_type:complete